jgi:signal transduction histidine kinase
MKRLLVLIAMVALSLLATQSFAADREAISKNVDTMVAAIDGGKAATDFAPDTYTPYAFIMDANGMLLVHPKLAGKDLKEVAKPIYDALQAATPAGVWVQYQWDGKEKNTYAKKTKNNLTVASGY